MYAMSSTPPTSSSASYPPVYNVVQTPVALRNALSQLSFEAEVLPDDMIDNPGTVWDGLFCLGGFNDEDSNDLFFDAEQEESSSSTSRSAAAMKIRGGQQSQDHPFHYTTTPNHSIPPPPLPPQNRPDEMFLQEKNEQGPVVTERLPEVPVVDSHQAASADNSPVVNNNVRPECFDPLPGPPPPQELPDRFLRAGKGDPVEGKRRYEATLAWRKEGGIDHILTDAHPNFDLIKRNYPHYFHLRGRNGEPVFFEQPPKTNLQAMRDGGVTLEDLLHHYAMVTEFQWQCVDRDDNARSITVLDLEGMGMKDFVGECIEYVRRCSEFTGQHYPERAGFVFVINVPFFFSMIWKVVSPWVDEVTLKKINILRGKKEVFDALLEKIPIENIPPEYGGHSVPLGESPEEHMLRDMIHHNNAVANGDLSCGGRGVDPPCYFCSFVPARSY